MKIPRIRLPQKDVLVVFWSRGRKKYYALNRKERKLREIPSLAAVEAKAFRRCFVVLGRALYILKVVEFPKLKKALIDKAIKTNIGEWSPFKANKYFFFSYPKGDKIVALVAICRLEDYEEAAGALKAKGLKIDLVLPETLCTENFFKGKSKTVAAVRTEDGVEILYFDGGIQESQFVPAQKWTEDALSYFVKRLGPAGLEIKEILFIGAAAAPGAFPEGLSPVFIRTEDDVETFVRGSDSLSSPWIKGLEKRRVVLFTPEDLGALRPALLIVLGGILLFSAAQFAAGLKKVHSLKTELTAVREESQGMEEKMDRTTALQANVAFLHETIERTPSGLAVLLELQSCFAEDTYLQRFSFNKDMIEFTGLSSQSADILSRLNASKFFKDVKFKSAIEKDRDTGKEKFSIELRLKR